jgi:hypothetical protein
VAHRELEMAQGLAEGTLHRADARAGRASCRVSVGELETAQRELERATEDFSMAHQRACDAEEALHRARGAMAAAAEKIAYLRQICAEDEERARACATYNADVAAAEAAELDFRADLAGRDSRWADLSERRLAELDFQRRFDAAPSADYPAYPGVTPSPRPGFWR